MRFWVVLCVRAARSGRARVAVLAGDVRRRRCAPTRPSCTGGWARRPARPSPTRAATAHAATYASPAEQRTRTGALGGDADSAVADARALVLGLV